jgi:hypothetical protein
MSDQNPITDIRRDFDAQGFSLRITPIASGSRYLACARHHTTSRGPLAISDTPEAAARAAWQRFETYRRHYISPPDS